MPENILEFGICILISFTYVYWEDLISWFGKPIDYKLKSSARRRFKRY